MAPKKRSREPPSSAPSVSDEAKPKARRTERADSTSDAVSPAFTMTKSPAASRKRRGHDDAESDAGSSSGTRAAQARGSRSPSAAEADDALEGFDNAFTGAETLTRIMDDEFAALERRKSQYALLVKRLHDLRAAFLVAKDQATDIIAARTPERHCEALALNVGGVRFVVPVATLLGRDDHSYFHSLLASRDSDVPVFFDANDDVFVDRDPDTFRLVLRYLHGSDHFDMLDEEQLAKLKVDAQFFQLEGLISILTDPPKELDHLLVHGPGVSLEQNRLRVMYCVGIIGDTQLVTGRHRITFEIITAEYAGVGLVSEACITQDQEFHKTMNCCVYYMSGVFYANFPHHRKEETLEKFESGDFVSILVDLDKGYAVFTLKNSTKVISIGRARRLRFAATLKLGSRVRIVPEAEVAQINASRGEPPVPTPELQMISAARLLATQATTQQ